MRVIGGRLRSRRLLGPPKGVRPTSDRVREALFATLGELAGARVLDPFAGTAALSIEAVSRGAAHAVVVERSQAALEVIRRNLAALEIADRFEVFRGDALRVVGRLAGREPFDLVLIDPPYRAELAEPMLAALVATDLVAAGGTVVVEGAKRHPVAAPRGMVIVAERDYGDTRITWLSPEAGCEEAGRRGRRRQQP